MQLGSIKDTKNFAKKISRILKAGDTIFLYGEIGAGKTTFVRFLINHLEIKNKIKNSDVLSPTFNIVYDYNIGKVNIQHYDLYRLKSSREIIELGIFDSQNQIKIVEWPELIKPKPKDRIDIIFKNSNLINSRSIVITGFGKWKDYNFNEK
tara:strand:+ start:480 stop:932 length:453 start_codon:yes stop_codon:yes gene_type:complete